MTNKHLQPKKALRTALIVLLLSVVGMTKGYAYDFSAVCPTGQTLYFNITDEENHYVELVDPMGSPYPGWNDYTTPSGIISLPSTVYYNDTVYSVTSIGNYAFYYCSGLISVEIPNSVTSIGYYAFYDCSGLISISVLADNPPAFRYNSFYGVNKGIPVYVACGNAEAYTVANWGGFSSFIEYCGGTVFVAASPGEGGMVMGGGVFGADEVCTVMATENEGYDFAGWTRDGMIVSLFVEYSFYVFGDIDLVAHFVPEGNIGFADANVKAICVSHWDTNGDGELSYAEAASVLSLGNYFSYNSEITSFDELQYFVGLTSIRNYAFNHCTGLTSVVLPNTVTIIEKSAFSNCSGLLSLTLPGSVTLIEENAFAYCGNQIELNYLGDIAQWCNTQFNDSFWGGANPLGYVDSFYVNNELVTDLVIPETVTKIKNYSFRGAKCFTSLTIPNSVTSIGGFAFSGCSSMTSVTIGNSVVSISNRAFEGCSSITSLTLGNSITSIGSYAFSGCDSLTSLTIGNSITSIGIAAFMSCSSLTTLTVGNSVTSIGGQAFDGCGGLNAVYYTGDIEQWCSIQFEQYYSNPLFCAHNLFIDNELVTDLVIPETVTEIKPYAFCGATCLTSLVIPNSVTSIGSCVFYNCSGLKDITIGNSVTSIGSYAFNNCNNVLSITSFANTPPTLGQNSFGSLNSNTVVYVPCGFEDAYVSLSWGGYSNFYGMCGGTVAVAANPVEGGTVTGGGTFEEGQTCTVMATAMEDYYFAKWTLNGMIVSYDPEYTFYAAGDMTLMAHFVPNGNIAFADSVVKSICVSHWDTNGDGELSYIEAALVTSLDQAFKGNTDITSFDELQYFIGLTSIGSYDFSQCSGLATIVMPNSVASIKSYAFYKCTGLTSLTIGNTVVSIGDCAFQNCSGMTGPLVIPNSVVLIGYSAFRDCSGLTSLTLGNSVTLIDRFAFYYCTGLTGSLTLPNSLTSIGTQAFRNCSGLTGSLVIPDSVTSIGYYAFQDCSGLTSLTIGNSVSSIGGYAFRGCSGLTSLTIGSSVTSIGNYAFQSSTGLGYLHVLAETPPSLGENVFGYSFPNIPVYVPCGTVEDYQAATDWSRFTNIIGTCSGEVSVTVNPLEGGMVTGEGYYTGGELCVLTATPNEGFAFVNWKENGRIASTDSVYIFPAHPTTIMANFCSNSPIVFADTTVKALCVANWDTNGDGELSYAEAAAVTDLGQVFQNKSTITSFDELQYFINLTSIGSSAFFDCTGLSSVTIGNSVTSIGYDAFNGCTSLTSVEIPNSVTSIGGYAFYYCINLEQIVVASGNTIYDSRGNCNAIIETATNTLLLGCKNTVIPYSVTEIGDSAFEGCTGLTTIVLPSSVTSINDGAFYGCSGLTAVYYTGDVSQWCNIQFADFWVDWWEDFLEREGVIGAGIGESNPLFHAHNLYIDNELVTDLVIPETVTEIKPWTFIDATCLTSLTIGSSVTNIGDGAFYGCNGLTSITVHAETPPTIQYYTFQNVPKSIPVYVPCGSVEAYQSAAYWSQFTNIQELCTQVQTIELSEGWNWVSFNVEVTLDVLKSALLEALPGTAISIMSQTQNTSYNPNNHRWVGSLAWDVAKMYKIKVIAPCEVTFEGLPINPAEHPLSILNGVNWIGFPLNSSMTLSNAFAGFAINGDRIRSQTNNALYNGIRWQGQLNALEPNKGYIYISNSSEDRNFTFPANAK